MPPRPAGRRRAPLERPPRRGRVLGLSVELLEDRVLRSDASGLGSAGLVPPARWSLPPAAAAETGRIGDDARIGSALIVAAPAARQGARGGRAAAFGWVVNHVGFEKSGSAPFAATTPTSAVTDEMAAPHPEPGQAQPVIGPGTAVIGGMVGSGDRSDFYRVESDSGGVRIGLRSNDPHSPMADRLVIVDESGRLVGDWTLPENTNEMTVELTGTDDELGHELFIGIGPGQNAGHDGTAEHYLLRIETLSRSAGGVSGPLATVGDTLTAFGQGVPAGPLGSAPAVAAPLGGMVDPDVAGSFVVAGRGGFIPGIRGPLPLLSATPFGGALMLEGPVEAATSDGVLLDLALAGVFLNLRDLPTAAGSLGPGPIVDRPEDGALPALVASHVRWEAPEPAGLVDLSVVADNHPAPTGPPAELTERPGRRGGGRHALLPLGLGLLATLATTMTLEDPRAGVARKRRRRRLPAWLRDWLGFTDPDA